LQGLDRHVTLDIQLDDKASIWLQGQRYTLLPDPTPKPIQLDRVGQDWSQKSDPSPIKV
jgi:hypothetical protein